jgi:trehalose 6-phosphate phosphatase
MRNILAKRNLATLIDFASSNVVVGLDYDGTLAPIAASPARARMRAATLQLLERVARVYPAVVISGRAHNDLTKRLGRVRLWEVFGNHGMEPWEPSRESAAQVDEWVTHLRRQLARYPELVIEDKKYSVTIHHGAVRDTARGRQAMAAAVDALPNVRALTGPRAVNLLPRGGPHKGDALQRARIALACQAAIYIGDDDTDEDAFTSADSDHLLAIRIGHSRTSGARYYLKAQAEIDALLWQLLAVRARRPSGAEPLRSATGPWPWAPQYSTTSY